jgi:hypothetical protein
MLSQITRSRAASVSLSPDISGTKSGAVGSGLLALLALMCWCISTSLVPGGHPHSLLGCKRVAVAPLNLIQVVPRSGSRGLDSSSHIKG